MTFGLRQRTLGSLGAEPTGSPAQKRKVKLVIGLLLGVTAVIATLMVAGILRIDPVVVAGNMTAAIISLSALYFGYRYFLRLGFLDGRPGLIFHFLQGFWFRFSRG